MIITGNTEIPYSTFCKDSDDTNKKQCYYKTEADGACTVFCPKCGIDAVISCSNACDSLSTKFLTKMNQYYFGF